MAAPFQLRQLISAPFLQELHHFLWTETRMVDDHVDAGWNCRDHAWILSFLLRTHGIDCVVAHGEAFFAMGPTAKRPATSYGQQPHSWIVARNLGAIDLSIKPEFCSAGDVFQLPIEWVFLNRAGAKIRCDAQFFNADGPFRLAAENLPLRRNQAGAAYRVREIEWLETDHGGFAADWIRSPLSDKLGTRYGRQSGPYAALLMHLESFLRGDARSLAALSFDEAWGVILDRRLSKTEPGNVNGAGASLLSTLGNNPG